jgi:hypothetical protein
MSHDDLMREAFQEAGVDTTPVPVGPGERAEARERERNAMEEAWAARRAEAEAEREARRQAREDAARAAAEGRDLAYRILGEES